MTEKLQELQLNLLIAMDAARDRVDEDSDPMMMFRHVVRILKVYFEADASSVLLVDVKTGEINEKVKLHYKYVEKIRVHNNKVYYVYRPFESIQKRFLL